MKVLLDTQVWLWLGFEPERIGAIAREIAGSRANTLFLSIASAWEIAIKSARGRLTLPVDAQTYVRSRLAISQVSLVSIALDHVFALTSLPQRHRDPFDRILAAQALVEGMSLMTFDPNVLAYPVATIDARR